MGLPRFSVNRPIAISMVFLGIVMTGIICLQRLPIELMPNFSFGDISIFVDIRGGMPPAEVENLVTRPIEEAVGTVSHLRDIISISEEGRSRVVLTIEPGIDMEFAALEVREEFSKVRDKLPDEIEKPVIAKFEQADVPILILAVTGLGYTPEMLRRLVDEKIKERLQRVEGVANIDVGGGRERKIMVEIDQRKLQAFGLPIGKVINQLSLSNLNLLVGDIEKTKDKYLIRTMGEFETIEQIKSLGIAVAPSGAIIRLKDMAQVKDSYLEPRSFARVDALPVVSLYIQKESLANTVEVSNGILKEVKLIESSLEDKIKIYPTYNQADSIKRAIASVEKALLYGALLAIAVLLLFLREIRSTVIIACAIPISVVATFSMMFFQKITLNIMTLSGLALGIGMLVDNSIVVLENVFKMGEKGIERPSAARRGSEEMTLAIVAATITTVVVFLPIVFVNKEIRILYAGLAMTITFSLLVSLFVALTLVPMMSARLPGGKGVLSRLFMRIKRKKAAIIPSVGTTTNPGGTGYYNGGGLENLPPHPNPSGEREKMGGYYNGGMPADPPQRPEPTRAEVTRVLRPPPLFYRIYRKILTAAIRNRYFLIISAFLAMTLVVTLVFPKLEKEFVGTTEQEDFTIFVELPTGAKLDISDRAVKEIEEILSATPEVKTVSSRVEPWSSKVYVKLVPLDQRTRLTRDVIDQLRSKVEEVERHYKEAFIYFEEPQEVETNEVILEIYGWDYEILNELAVGMLTRMQTVEGLTDLKLRWRRGRPEWQVQVDKEKAALFGLSVEDVANVLHAQMRGLRATLYHTEAREVEVIARLRPADRKTLDMVRKLTIVLPDGKQIYLEQMAKLVPAVGPSKIWRKNKNRMIQVSANRGRLPFGTAAEKINQSIADMKFPEDYYWRFGENYWRMIRNQQELTFALILTLILIYLVLASLFESYTQPFIIMVTVPLAAIGVILVLEKLHRPINIGVLMGAIMLGGIVVNNAIIMVDYLNRLRKKGFPRFRVILIGAEGRLRPIAMTTCTTILAMIPLAIDRSPEANLWSPLAITVMAGLASSTILTLIIVPCIYLAFDDVKGLLKRLGFKVGKLKRSPSLQTG